MASAILYGMYQNGQCEYHAIVIKIIWILYASYVHFNFWGQIPMCERRKRALQLELCTKFSKFFSISIDFIDDFIFYRILKKKIDDLKFYRILKKKIGYVLDRLDQYVLPLSKNWTNLCNIWWQLYSYFESSCTQQPARHDYLKCPRTYFFQRNVRFYMTHSRCCFFRSKLYPRYAA